MFWICIWFWICQDSEYVRVTQGSEYAWIYCLIMSGWICLDMSEYANICVNVPKSAWMAFVLYFPVVIPCLLERVATYFNVFIKLEVLIMKEIQNVFLKIQNLSFSFCFRLNIFTSSCKKCCYLWGPWGVGAVNLDIPYLNLLLFLVFVLKSNVDVKNMQNNDARIHLKLELQKIGCWCNIYAMRI